MNAGDRNVFDGEHANLLQDSRLICKNNSNWARKAWMYSEKVKKILWNSSWFT